MSALAEVVMGTMTLLSARVLFDSWFMLLAVKFRLIFPSAPVSPDVGCRRIASRRWRGKEEEEKRWKKIVDMIEMEVELSEVHTTQRM